MSQPLKDGVSAKLREAVEPFLNECYRIGGEYGFDRPDWQFQPLMVQMLDIKALIQAANLYDDEDGS